VGGGRGGGVVLGAREAFKDVPTFPTFPVWVSPVRSMRIIQHCQVEHTQLTRDESFGGGIDLAVVCVAIGEYAAAHPYQPGMSAARWPARGTFSGARPQINHPV
jgi:hypothetical protein